MWQTIQILLGPEEHSVFLMEAVKRWDLIDPSTGEILPKILPRQCFPATPDKHMVAWYEGVSERLRTEAEEEIRKLEDEKEADRSRVAVRGHDTDDEESVDSRGPALAYFRNPLYRHVDGKSTVVQHGPKRPPPVSPRPSSLRGKSKDAAMRFGHAVKSVANPHLWDGREHRHGSRPGSRDRSRDRDRERRRRSLPHHLPGDPPPERDPYDEKLPPPAPMQPRRHSRRRSSRVEPRPIINRPEDDWDADEDAAYSREQSPIPSRPRPGGPDFNDPQLRHSRSHDPTPTSQRDGDDYFQSEEPPGRRRASAYEDSPDAPPRQPGIGPSFAPSAAPLFASHVGRQAPPFPPNGPGREPPISGPLPPPPPMNYDPRQYPGPPNRRPRPPRHPDYDGPPSRSRNRHHSRSPPPRRRGSRPSGSRPRPPYDDRYPSPGRGPPPGPEPRRRSRPPPGPRPPYGDPRDMSPGGSPRLEPRRRSRPPPPPPPGPGPRYGDPRDDLYDSGEESMSPPPSPDDRRARRHSRRKSRGGGGVGPGGPDDFGRGSDVDGFYSAPEGPDRRSGQGRPKVTRFANEPVSGVDGRRYPDMPWR